MSSRPRRFAPCIRALAGLSLLSALLVSRSARAEKVLAKGDDWEVYTDGRVGAFASYSVGDGPPVATKMITMPDGTVVPENLTPPGWQISDTQKDATTQGKVNMMRVRSGFIGNVLGIGGRYQVFPNLKASTYFQIWAFVESDGRNKGFPNPADVRQGYGKLEGAWGSFLAGRTRTLFSRGATDINVMYAHRWGVGFPNVVDGKGPTQGMVGFGVLGSGFAAGLIYGSPILAGFQLNIGIFDPANLGAGQLSRTKLARPEAELTFEQPLGSIGKIVLFANGAYQAVYKGGVCPVDANDKGPCEQNVLGVGYGGRLEVGPVHLGVAGHYGTGLGLSYALENSYATIDPQGHLRVSDGYYAQLQVEAGPFEPFAGWGITRIFLTDFDRTQPQNSNIKYQMGINGGVVYNLSPAIHFDLEYMRADAEWWLGEHQILDNFATGMTVSW
jgi:hypothetical protein